MKNNKSLGQHWLKNRAILDEIAALASAKPTNSDSANAEAVNSNSSRTKYETHDKSTGANRVVNEICLEIGPGLGTLTSSLLRKFSQVIAVEYDAGLARKLPGQFPGKNLQIVHADILKTDINQLISAAGDVPNDKSRTEFVASSLRSEHSTQSNQPFVIVGNIPYYITSPIVRQVLTLPQPPRRVVLLMQKEVAERIAAEPGKHSLLSLFAQNLAAVELGPVVRGAEFTPPPKVDSQILILDPYSEPQINPAILQLAKRGFSSPRKKLAHNLANQQLSKSAWQELLLQNSINPNARAEDLDLWDWENLYQATNLTD